MAEREKNKAVDSEIEGGKVVEHFSNQTQPSTGQTGPKIKRGRYDSLVLYEVSEAELDIIERGSPNSTYLNFAIFLLSIGLSFLATLLTFNFGPESSKKFTVFVVITVVGLLGGLVLLIIWYRAKNQFDTVIKKIKERIVE